MLGEQPSVVQKWMKWSDAIYRATTQKYEPHLSCFEPVQQKTAYLFMLGGCECKFVGGTDDRNSGQHLHDHFAKTLGLVGRVNSSKGGRIIMGTNLQGSISLVVNHAEEMGTTLSS